MNIQINTPAIGDLQIDSYPLIASTFNNIKLYRNSLRRLFNTRIKAYFIGVDSMVTIINDMDANDLGIFVKYGYGYSSSMGDHLRFYITHVNGINNADGTTTLNDSGSIYYSSFKVGEMVFTGTREINRFEVINGVDYRTQGGASKGVLAQPPTELGNFINCGLDYIFVPPISEAGFFVGRKFLLSNDSRPGFRGIVEQIQNAPNGIGFFFSFALIKGRIFMLITGAKLIGSKIVEDTTLCYSSINIVGGGPVPPNGVPQIPQD